ncbi:hypothetical protein ANO11243_081080 [Dothideomycetidae sp. 11243]|nr:hypothetical protein ANO11243_081080 [fungal sp. No.11243]
MGELPHLDHPTYTFGQEGSLVFNTSQIEGTVESDWVNREMTGGGHAMPCHVKPCPIRAPCLQDCAPISRFRRPSSPFGHHARPDAQRQANRARWASEVGAGAGAAHRDETTITTSRGIQGALADATQTKTRGRADAGHPSRKSRKTAQSWSRPAFCSSTCAWCVSD